jgi:hypothetical protein
VFFIQSSRRARISSNTVWSAGSPAKLFAFGEHGGGVLLVEAPDVLPALGAGAALRLVGDVVGLLGEEGGEDRGYRDKSPPKYTSQPLDARDASTILFSVLSITLIDNTENNEEEVMGREVGAGSLVRDVGSGGQPGSGHLVRASEREANGRWTGCSFASRRR